MEKSYFTSKNNVKAKDYTNILDDAEEHDKSKSYDSLPFAYKHVKLKSEYISENVLLSVNHLKVFYKKKHFLKKEYIKAVHDINFKIHKGEIFGIVGEEGSGKTITAKAIVGEESITSGAVYFKGARIAAGDRWNRKEIEWSKKNGKKEIERLKNAKTVEEVEDHPSKVDNLYVGKEILDYSLVRSKYVVSTRFLIYSELSKGHSFDYALKYIEALAESFIGGTYDRSKYFFINDQEANENGYHLLRRIKVLTEKDVLDSLLPTNDLALLIQSRIKTVKMNIKLIKEEQTRKIKQIKFDNENNDYRLRIQIQPLFLNALDPDMNVRDVLTSRIKSLNNAAIAERSSKALEEVGLVSSYFSLSVKDLKSFEAVKVELAAALAANPELLIVNDLPKTLTKEEEEEFIELLRKLRNKRMISILFMSRNLNLAKQICDTISILHDGDMVELAKKDELLSNPIHPYGKAFVKAFEKDDGDHKVDYDSSKKRDYSKEKPTFQAVIPGHYVLFDTNEAIAYKSLIQSQNKFNK